ncbi:Tex-like N-terminal domain-containing protein [Tundrisphaera lichenicola]|uniref:Tex-like N-terminal domain-containing protein n=1 Tax=Tundrisphaera lichenicola TaxID=2029860 RepID=UPI003EB8FB15
MDTPIQVDLGRIAQDLQIRRVQVESVVQLLDEGNTVPFITRYRKERTGNLNEIAIREIQLRVGRLRELAERKETILKAIEAQGKLSEELAAAIRSADNAKRLEDLYLPFKPKKKTKASDARDKGLEPLALRIWNHDDTLTDLDAAAQEFVNAEKELESTEKVLEGVGHILAEAINELAIVRDAVRRVVWKTGKISTTKAEIAEGEGLEYRDYFAYSEPIANIPPHRVLAINRGDKEGPLKVKLEVNRQELEGATFSQLPLDQHPQADFFRKSALDALDRLLLPSMEREVRRDLTEMAERHAVDVFARNLRSLLLQPPITKQVVMAIDPGFRNGCKVAVLGEHGELLDHGVIHPHPPQNRRHEAKVFLKDLVGKHKVGVVAIGNGTACRETEELIAEIIAEGTHFHENPEATSIEAPAGSAEPATAPAAEAPEPPIETPAEPAEAAMATPGEAEASVETTPTEPVAHEATNGDATPPKAEGETQEPVESLPPISGGSPEAEEETQPEATQPPPSTPEAEAPTHAEATPSPAEVVAETPEAPEAPAEVASEPAATPEVPEVAAEAPASTETPGLAPDEAQHGEGSTPAAEEEITAVGAPTEPPSAEATPTEAPKKPPRDREARQKNKQDQPPRPPKPRQPPPPPKPHPADAQLAQLAYVIVNEAGASVYSVSPVGREEFPDFDDKVRGTISIGRRLQDPLAELVKIEPQNIGVGLYQHDVNPKQLKESLEGVIASCVNFVGVDLNTASVPLLRHVSGLNQLTARRVVERRSQQGPYKSRAELMEVEGIGPATFTQAAGFLKIGGGANPLDRTWVHPESYPTVEKLLEKFELTPEVVRDREKLPDLHTKLNEADVAAVAKELEVGEPTLHDIFEALARPDRDPRDDLPKPIFKKGVLKLEDLVAGMELKGTVLNVVDFGAFVDIGLKDSGLVHISQLANRYIKSPHDVVSVGDVVSVWVMGVDGERKRVSLTMVKPGTERPRGERQSGGRRPQGEGGERRSGGPRGPRREAGTPSNLTSPPVGTPAGGQPGGEGPPRRPDSRPGGRESNFRPAGGGQNRGGPRPGGYGGGPGGNRGGGGGGRFERPATPSPIMTPRPTKPAPPPPPLSKDALTGSVPLRSFGQLKQLWTAKVEGPNEGEGGESPESAPAPETPPESPASGSES